MKRAFVVAYVCLFCLLFVNCSPTNQSFLDQAYNRDFAGTKVVIWGPMLDAQEEKFTNSMTSFEEETGIDIEYEGLKEFESLIEVRLKNGDGPDIANFPQPGFLAKMVKAGYIQDASQFINMDRLKSRYNQSWLDMAMMPGPDNQPIMAGVWHRVSTKSLVWYPKDDFEAAGYTVPQTWEQLMALTKQLNKDGHTPWCIGIESGAATGWAATDWVEDILLRTTSLENYDKWTKGELAFNSPEVKRAIGLMSDIWLTEGYVEGGGVGIANNPVRQAGNPMFENPPQCWLHRQASFVVNYFPPEAVAGKDYDFFYLPPIDSVYGKPMLVAGDMMAMVSNRPEVKAVMEYFSTGKGVENWVRAGGAISPHRDSSLQWYANPTEQKIATLLLQADSVRFDGSDLMPGEVGAGSFWLNITAYVSGSKELEQTLQDIDASWPK